MESPESNEEMMVEGKQTENDNSEKNTNQSNKYSKNNHHENRTIQINYRVNFDVDMKTAYSVANAKYTEDCRCGISPIVEVIFSDKRKKLFKNEHNLYLQLFEYVIVQVDSGLEYGTVIACGSEANEKLKLIYGNQIPEHIVVRHAHSEDMDKIKRNHALKQPTVDKAKEIITTFKLDMKVNDAEWQFDRQKLVIFFTAPQRIDFRELVKELARTFKTRIELRQISNREEARRIGGMGPCGLNLCCASFTNENCHVTLDHARHQQLCNNISKLSGYCGRLKCCLLYEHDIYTQVMDKYPVLNSSIDTSEGNAILNKIDVFKETATLFITDTGVYRTISGEQLLQYTKDGKVTPPAEDELKKSAIDSDLAEFSDIADY